MSPRSFYLAGIAFLAIALILSLLVSVSLPFLSGLDFVRINWGHTPSGTDFTSQIRLGIWAPCFYDGDDRRSCLFGGHGYSFHLRSFDLKQDFIIGSSWTRGLAIHPVAAVFTAVAFGFAVSKGDNSPLFATLASFLAAFLTGIAFIVDIALYAYVKQQASKLSDPGNTTASSAFWMTFVSLILLLMSGCTVCFGRRRDIGAGSPSYPSISSSNKGILSRFRKS
ncbi:pali-domain-containing protein [Mycena crocata]|nr:pali-domain-containing protein [Mycena crocata]